MSNSGTGGRASGFSFSLRAFGDGFGPARPLSEDGGRDGETLISAELHELERLVSKYPDEAREFLGNLPPDPPDGSGSPP